MGWIIDYLILNAIVTAAAVVIVLTSARKEWHWEMPVIFLAYPVAVILAYSIVTGVVVFVKMAAKLIMAIVARR